ncbi:integrase/recombinase xerD homolog [Rhinophrynus dorsalis]
MVSSTVGIIGGFSPPSTNVSTPVVGPLRRSARSLNIRGPSTSCVVPFGGTSGTSDLSNSAQALLAESWAPGTRAMYGSAWSAWSRWCVERDLDPVSASTVSVANFLSTLYDSGKAYRTINTYRSAISAGHVPSGGIPVGQSVVVCRLMRGIRFSRPPQSRYQSLWDVNDVLRFLENWPPNNLLSLKQLSAKLTMLLCLVSFKRVSDVKALDILSRSFTSQGVQFRVSRRTKTSIQTVSYPSFPTHPQLCVVRCLQEYELRTAILRRPACPQLLISFRSPHLPVSAATLARWVRWVMQLAGIDVSLFGAHSTRGAMASMAVRAGGRLEDILRAADWSKESTFKNFYCKPVEHVASTVVAHL